MRRPLADARAAAKTISDETRAKIQAELDRELAAADARIAEKTAQSEQAINEIRETSVEKRASRGDPMWPRRSCR